MTGEIMDEFSEVGKKAVGLVKGTAEAPEAKGFNAGTFWIEAMASMFYMITVLGILMATSMADPHLTNAASDATGGDDNGFAGAVDDAASQAASQAASATSVALDGWTIFLAFGLGGTIGVIVEQADFNPGLSVTRFMLTKKENRDWKKLFQRFLGQLFGMIIACLIVWVSTGDINMSGFYPPVLNDHTNYNFAKGLCLCFFSSGIGYWTLDAYGHYKWEKHLAYFLTYGWQAYFTWGYVRMGFNWMDCLARGIMATINGNNNGGKDTFKGKYFWGAFWVIVVGSGVLAPLFTYFMVHVQWPMIAKMSAAEAQQRKADETEEMPQSPLDGSTSNV